VGGKAFAKQLLTGVLSIAKQPQARYHKQGRSQIPHRRSIPISPLPSIPLLSFPPNPHLQPRDYLPPLVASPSTPTLLQTKAACARGGWKALTNEQFVEGVDTRAAQVRELMANKYENRSRDDRVQESATLVPFRFPKQDRSSGASATRIFYRVLRRRVHLYTLQSKHSILCSSYAAKTLSQIDQATAEVDAREIGNSRRKITHRYAAKSRSHWSDKEDLLRLLRSLSDSSLRVP
jgi:hypothetical protein